VTVDAARRYSGPGPYEVGVLELTMGDRPVTVWYPAQAGSSAGKAKATFDMRTLLPAAERSKVTSPDGAVFAMDAYEGLPTPNDDGPFPLVLFSHGISGYRTQSSFLTTHLASWGFVVAAPEHLSRDLTAVLSGTVGQGQDDVADLRQSLAVVTDPARDPVLARVIDARRVAVVGHSLGGSAAIKLAADPSIATYVALASGPTGLTPPPKPALYVAGSADVIAPAERVAQGFPAVPAPKRLVVIGGATHLSFMDYCPIGRDRGGMLAIAKADGVSVPDLVTKLVADGCDAKFLRAEDAWPLIDELVTAHLRWALGADPAPVGLGDELAAAWAPIPVTVTTG